MKKFIDSLISILNSWGKFLEVILTHILLHLWVQLSAFILFNK